MKPKSEYHSPFDRSFGLPIHARRSTIPKRRQRYFTDATLMAYLNSKTRLRRGLPTRLEDPRAKTVPDQAVDIFHTTMPGI
jgi:hypothetical protein